MGNRKRQWLIASVLVMSSVLYGSSIPLGSDAVHHRTIVITAENMMFNGNNPTIPLEPGESVRLVFRNQDPGMKHDLIIPALGLATGIIEAGEEVVLEFHVPDDGTFEYFCSLHPVSMRGMFAVGYAPGSDEVAERSGP